jgi:hypothetical protein
MKNTLSKLLFVIFLGLGVLATSSSALAWSHYQRIYYYYSDSSVKDCNGCCKFVRCKVFGYYDQCGNWVTTRNVCWYRN